MIYKQCLELFKVLFQSKENVSKFKFFTASSIQKILLLKHAAAIKGRHKKHFGGYYCIKLKVMNCKIVMPMRSEIAFKCESIF